MPWPVFYWGFLGEEPSRKKDLVTLTDAERQTLHALIAAGKAAAQKRAPARIRLEADAAPEGPTWPDEPIAEALDVGLSTVAGVRQRLVEQGWDAALGRKPQDRPSRPRKLDGAAEARRIAWACSAPPPGRADGTMRL